MPSDNPSMQNYPGPGVGNAPAANAQGSPGPENQGAINEAEGSGVEGEQDIWLARYSLKNFVGRGIFLLILTGLWLYVALYNRQVGDRMSLFTMSYGVVVLLFWVFLGLRILQSRYSLYYRMTTRRLFHSSGLLHRRRDQMELLRVKDVFTRQSSLLERMLGLGTVVVVPNDKELPTFFFNGVDNPKQVMDLIWHHTRSEHDHRSVKVEQA